MTDSSSVRQRALDERLPLGERVLAYDGGTVNWHRVLRSNGTCAEHLQATQLALLAAEGVPIRNGKVDMAAARWDGR